jgi:hypothetical protein
MTTREQLNNQILGFFNVQREASAQAREDLKACPCGGRMVDECVDGENFECEGFMRCNRCRREIW